MNVNLLPGLHAFRRLALTCAALLAFLPSPSSAKPHKHPAKSEPSAPAAGPEWVPPGDWPVGARVNAFLQTYLEQSILAPLDAPAPPPRAALGTLGIDFAAHLAAAQSPTERALYADATNLCDLLGRLLDERELRQDTLLNLRSGGNAVNPLDMPASGVSGHYSWNLEAERARAQRRQDIQARLNALDKKNFFVTSNLRQWTDLAVGYRRTVQSATVRINADQIRMDAAAKAPTAPVAVATPLASPPPVAVATPLASPTPVLPLPAVAAPTPVGVASEAAATPAPPAPTATAPNATSSSDPVAGSWRFGDQSAELSPWHTIDGQRHGSWSYMMDTPQGRYYEFHFQKKGLVSYMTLSGDGNHLNGKDQDGKPTSADRK